MNSAMVLPAVTMGLRKELTDIEYGRAPDRHGWLVRLDA